MQTAVHALIAAFDSRGIDLSEARDFLRETLIPEFPAQAFGQLVGNGSGTTTELALDGDEAKHIFLCS